MTPEEGGIFKIATEGVEVDGGGKGDDKSLGRRGIGTESGVPDG